MAGQWTYSPYGEVLTYDQLDEHPAVVFGHKTLAIDRLDGPTLTWQDESEPEEGDWQFFETRRLEPGARLLGYARNRTLDVQRGRWLQNDPNASGLGVLSSASFHGRVWIAAAGDAGLASRIGDGLSLYGYCGGSPIALGDSLGLFSYGELAGTMGIQGLIGGMINGSLSQFTGGSFWGGFASGAIGGAAGGGFGYMAFGASASGLIGQVASNGAGGFVQGMYQSGGNFSAALSNAWWSSVSTGVLGGIGKGAMAAAGASGLTAGAKSVLWRMGNKWRGLAAEDIARMSLSGSPTPLDFPVVDQWDDVIGKAFSIKSMNTSSYSSGGIASKVSGYLSNLASFRGANAGGLKIPESAIRQRELVLAISEDNAAFQAAFSTIQFQARSLGITVSVQVLP